jgi:RNA polymerase sigma factor (sigma-70 family)
VDERHGLIERFEEHRARLRALAYRMLGSLSDADDALQDAWVRVSRVDPAGVENPGGFFTTVVANVCLSMLRTRNSRPEEPRGMRLPEPIVRPDDGRGLEDEVILADAVGLALLVVLDTLAPAERVAFVLHDTFAVPFDEIAAILGRSPAAARQLASRARRRVQASAPMPEGDVADQRRVVDAFVAAARRGDLDSLIAVLDPDVVLRGDDGTEGRRAEREVRGAANVARLALAFSRPHQIVRPVLVNGAAGILATVRGRPVSLLAFTVRRGKIAQIHVLADPDRLRRLDLAAPGAPRGEGEGTTRGPHRG